MQNYFTDTEMQCKHCGQKGMDENFMEKLNLARAVAGFPFVVNSGYRCPIHNRKVGSTTTNHPRGLAADIICEDDDKRFIMVRAMIGVEMSGIGIGHNFVHCDINHGTPMIWTY